MVRKIPPADAQDDTGQAITEYLLLLALVASLFLMVTRALDSLGLAEKLVRPVKENYARAYQYGNPKTKGFEDGGPEMHPRAVGGNNFRMFINRRPR